MNKYDEVMKFWDDWHEKRLQEYDYILSKAFHR